MDNIHVDTHMTGICLLETCLHLLVSNQLIIILTLVPLFGVFASWSCNSKEKIIAVAIIIEMVEFGQILACLEVFEPYIKCPSAI